MLAETGVDSAKAVVPKLLRYRRDTVACHATGCDDCMVRACVECSPTELWLCQECAAQPGVELATEVRGPDRGKTERPRVRGSRGTIGCEGVGGGEVKEA